MLAILLFGNGFILAYALRLNVPAHQILFLFALVPLISMVLTLPLAWFSDRAGKKKLGGIGLIVSIAGFAILPLAAFVPEYALWCLVAGTLIFSVGNTANGASWFALLSPIVPEKIRGRWFGQMRTSWQSISILFSFGLTILLRHQSDLYVFQIMMVLTCALMVLRLALYIKIPELEPPRATSCGFFRTLKNILIIPGYLRFCIYSFLLAFTNAAAGLFGLLQKETLGFSDSQLLMMGNLASIGSVAGFLIGGKMVDRVGTKPVLLTGHIVASLALAGFLFRNGLPAPMTVVIGTLLFCFGAMQGAIGIATTSELLTLLPPENKSLSTGFNITISAAGLSLAGLINAHLLKINILPAQWTLFTHSMSAYDILIAGFMVLTLLLGATLGLVPTIRHLHSQWFPQN